MPGVSNSGKVEWKKPECISGKELQRGLTFVIATSALTDRHFPFFKTVQIPVIYAFSRRKKYKTKHTILLYYCTSGLPHLRNLVTVVFICKVILIELSIVLAVEWTQKLLSTPVQYLYTQQRLFCWAKWAKALPKSWASSNLQSHILVFLLTPATLSHRNSDMRNAN